MEDRNIEQITITKDDFHKAIAVALEKMTDELKEQNSSPLARFASVYRNDDHYSGLLILSVY